MFVSYLVNYIEVKCNMIINLYLFFVQRDIYSSTLGRLDVCSSFITNCTTGYVLCEVTEFSPCLGLKTFFKIYPPGVATRLQ